MEAIGLFLAGLFTGYILTWPTLALLFIIGVCCEHNDRSGWAVFFGIVAAVVGYFYFGLALTTVLWYALAYFGVGIVWSFWRYGRYVRSEVARIKADTHIKQTDYETYAKNLRPAKHAGRITSWVIVWPISFVNLIVGDLIDTVQFVVTNFFKKIYNKIYTSLVADLVK